MFSKKLDFLMNVTNTHNSALAASICIDASAVSRLRNGKRSLPRFHNFLPQMALFFAERLTEDYQKKAVADQIISSMPWPESTDDAASIICLWFFKSDETENSPPDPEILKITNTRLHKYEHCINRSKLSVSQMPRFFYGEQGFRDSILAFMDAVISDGQPRELLLFCEEEPGWQANDAGFPAQWTRRFVEALQLGCTVKIIHDYARPVDGMLQGFTWWLPYCLNGAVIPYYCPKVRDSMHNRSLFVAPGLAALQTTVVGKRSSKDLAQLIYEPAAVTSLEYEYNSYLEKCSPLLELLQSDENLHFLERLLGMERQPDAFTIASLTQALAALPNMDYGKHLPQNSL